MPVTDLNKNGRKVPKSCIQCQKRPTAVQNTEKKKNEQIQGKYQDNKKEIFFKVTGDSFIIYKLEYFSLSSSV